ncbi:MAG: response regulator [Gammaproteobacteria bacterium]|nr:response regulator [Gammaproteobacteria bacterium]
MRERSAHDTAQDTWHVGASDLAQAGVRVAIVSTVAVWSYVNAGRPPLAAFSDFEYLVLPLAYLACALGLLGWSLVLERRGTTGTPLHVRRACGLVGDVAALSAYTAAGGHHALIVFPVYLMVIIGYGYRFGLAYLYFAILASCAGFGLAYPRNPAFEDQPVLVIAYCLSLVCVPGYAALLLRRHQEVLARLHEVLEARARFIANISHELRTPLHTIISSAHAGLEADGDPRQQDTALRLIAEAARHLLALVNRVLDIAAARAGALRLPIAPADLYAVVRGAVDICRPQALAKGVDCFWYVDADVPRHVMTAGAQLQEVLINLLGNAVKFTPAGHARLRLVTGHDTAGRDTLHFHITDTGPGIAPSLLGRLFQPFTLGDAGTARAQAGTGLGLAISREYVEALGGSIAIRSLEGEGTSCEVVLPLESAPEPTAPTDTLFCVVIAPRALSTSERGAFANAGFDPLCMTPTAWRERRAIAPPGAIFVHRDHLDLPGIATGALLPAGSQALLAAYGVDRDDAAILPAAFETRAATAAVVELLAVHELAASKTAPQASRIERAARPLCLLVVDDNLTNLLAAGHALRAAGHAVDCASTAEDALRRARSRAYDLALVDLHLPGTSGLEIVAAIGRLGPTPCAILTADVTAAAHDAALASGAVGVLAKPIAPAELRAAAVRLAARPAGTLVGTLFAELVADVPPGAALDELIAAFGAEARTLVAEIAEARDDAARTRRVLHRLKACAAAMGAEKLFERVTALEATDREPQTGPGDAIELGIVLERTVEAMRAAAVPHAQGEAG